MLIVEVYLCLSESTSVPILISIYMTEHEFLLSMHCLFPFVLCLLRIFGEYLYVDLDLTIEIALNDVVKHEKVKCYIIAFCYICTNYLNKVLIYVVVEMQGCSRHLTATTA